MSDGTKPEPETSDVRPTTINKLRDEAALSFAMLAGMQLDVFTPLHAGPLTLDQLADALDVRALKLRPLAYALVAAGLLTVDDELFSNTAESDRFLVKNSSDYMGAMHENLAFNWANMLKTGDSIRTGVPQAPLDFHNQSEEKLEAFLSGLHHQAMRNGLELAEAVDLCSWCGSLVDVGGGSGGLAIAIAERCPDMQATVMELPSVAKIARRFVERSSVVDRVSIVSANVLQDELRGSFDAAVLRAFIQVLSPEDALRALVRVRGIIAPGGRLYIIGRVVDNSRLAPLSSVAFGLSIVNVYDHGLTYSEQEYRDWLEKSGFRGFEFSSLSGGLTLIAASKA